MLWLIAETDYGRRLKIVFIQKDLALIIKTAYDPNPTESKIHDNFGTQIA